MYRPRNYDRYFRGSPHDTPLSESSSFAFNGSEKKRGGESMQDTTYDQHVDDPTPESNPAGNPAGALLDAIHAEKIDRAELLKNLDKLSNLELIRLSRSSYLKHANRYRIKN